MHDQGIQRNTVEHDRDEDLTLARTQFRIHRPAQRGEQVALA